jgi:hypothetical protein
MALQSAFWFLLAGLLIVAPLPASAASSWASAGGYALNNSDPGDKCGPVLAATSATCDAAHSSTDPLSGETKSGEVHVGADLASGDLFVHAKSAASIPTAEAGGEAQIGDTLSFGGAISPTSITTFRMSGTMSTSNGDPNSNGFAAGWLDIYDDNGLLTGGVACSTPNSAFGCGSTNHQTEVTVVGNSFFISSTVNVDLYKDILVEFVVYASSFLTSSADITDPITIDLPPGVTFTSASGVFLTRAGSVPETSTWALMLLGFVGLGYLGYRKNEASRWRPCLNQQAASSLAIAKGRIERLSKFELTISCLKPKYGLSLSVMTNSTGNLPLQSGDLGRRRAPRIATRTGAKRLGRKILFESAVTH